MVRSRHRHCIFLERTQKIHHVSMLFLIELVEVVFPEVPVLLTELRQSCFWRSAEAQESSNDAAEPRTIWGRPVIRDKSNLRERLS